MPILTLILFVSDAVVLGVSHEAGMLHVLAAADGAGELAAVQLEVVDV